MARSPRIPVLSGVDEQRVDALARRVISALRDKPPRELRERIGDATEWLVHAVLAQDVFVAEDARAELIGRGITPMDVMDHCVADAARDLGARWVADRASFSEVSLGSARLHGLCKHLSVDWDFDRNLRPAASVLIAVCTHEDHLIGPVILADQLRRAGYSVHLMVQATPDKLVRKLVSEPFSTVLISCGSVFALETVKQTVAATRARLVRPPRIVLGGPVLDHADDLVERTGVDLVTSSIAAALSAPEGPSRRAAAAKK